MQSPRHLLEGHARNQDAISMQSPRHLLEGHDEVLRHHLRLLLLLRTRDLLLLLRHRRPQHGEASMHTRR